ncbi:hypothetical protein SAMN05444336_102106 [Albimonas donghaensis]|uniref:Uncharacterized protein n=1 Tax=Albimonas donghaensis TaxID=356660 RepID=A0A1H2VL26_9RHOB|nr:hypothetical protein SAMN05444336_102106 [Albimonas donghaensis]
MARPVQTPFPPDRPPPFVPLRPVPSPCPRSPGSGLVRPTLGKQATSPPRSHPPPVREGRSCAARPFRRVHAASRAWLRGGAWRLTRRMTRGGLGAGPLPPRDAGRPCATSAPRARRDARAPNRIALPPQGQPPAPSSTHGAPGAPPPRRHPRTAATPRGRAGATGARVVARPARTEGASARTCERRAGGLRRGVGFAMMRADQAAAEAPAPPKRASRPAMISSASAMIRSTSSFTVGTSWISAWMVPAVQIPASTSPV